MKLKVGILLFVFSIITGSSLYASDVSIETAPPVPPSTELLDNEYVELQLPNNSSVLFSILQTVQDLTAVIQTRYLSLLSWKLHSRPEREVENYNRLAQFGRWINDPNDDVCFNTRAKVLVRDSFKDVVFRDTNHCSVEAGAWKDPYTTSTIKISREVQIDHLVPLKNAYLSGAHKWSFRARCLYANYLGIDFHLLSVDGIQNMKKGDRTPAAYMPPNPRYACTYVRNWLAVKMLWGLTMSHTEADAIHDIIINNSCDLTEFRMSEHEYNSQHQFAKENIDLCEKIDREAQKNKLN